MATPRLFWSSICLLLIPLAVSTTPKDMRPTLEEQGSSSVTQAPTLADASTLKRKLLNDDAFWQYTDHVLTEEGIYDVLDNSITSTYHGNKGYQRWTIESTEQVPFDMDFRRIVPLMEQILFQLQGIRDAVQ